MSNTRKMVKMSLLLAVAIVLNYFESLIPLPFPFPGVKIGIANSIGLVVLFLGNKKDYLLFMILKLILIALLKTGFGTSFFIGGGGTLFAVISTLFIYKITKASIFGLSIVGASFHSLGQIIVISFIYSSQYMINYLPILLISSIASGFLTAYLASALLKKMPINSMKKNF